MGIFQCDVSFRGCTFIYHICFLKATWQGQIFSGVCSTKFQPASFAPFSINANPGLWQLCQCVSWNAVGPRPRKSALAGERGKYLWRCAPTYAHRHIYAFYIHIRCKDWIIDHCMFFFCVCFRMLHVCIWMCLHICKYKSTCAYLWWCAVISKNIGRHCNSIYTYVLESPLWSLRWQGGVVFLFPFFSALFGCPWEVLFHPCSTKFLQFFFFKVFWTSGLILYTPEI